MIWPIRIVLSAIFMSTTLKVCFHLRPLTQPMSYLITKLIYPFTSLNYPLVQRKSYIYTYINICVCVCSSLSCVWLCDPVDCSLAVHWSLQARILEWVAISFSNVSSQYTHTHTHTHTHIRKLKINFPKKPKYRVNQFIFLERNLQVKNINTLFVPSQFLQ